MRRGVANRAASIRAARSAQQYARRVPRKRSKPTPRVLSDVTDPSLTRLDTKQMEGELPPFNDWGSFVVDHDHQKIYAYGGYRPNSETSTADFFSCDMTTLQWRNLTVSNSAILVMHSYTPGARSSIVLSFAIHMIRFQRMESIPNPRSYPDCTALLAHSSISMEVTSSFFLGAMMLQRAV
jgi:hypothetical protein